MQARKPGRRRRSLRRADLGAAPVSLARSAAVRAEGRHPHRLAHRSHHAPQLLFALGAPGADRLQRLVAVDECSVACFAVSRHLRCRRDVSEAPARRVQSHNAYRRERGRQLQPDIALAERLEAVTSFGGRDASHRGHQRHPPCLSHSSRLSRAQLGSLLLLRRRLLPTPSKLSRRFAILGLNAKRWASDGQRTSTAEVRAASHDLAV